LLGAKTEILVYQIYGKRRWGERALLFSNQHNKTTAHGQAKEKV
jgi:hypothetical protein